MVLEIFEGRRNDFGVLRVLDVEAVDAQGGQAVAPEPDSSSELLAGQAHRLRIHGAFELSEGSFDLPGNGVTDALWVGERDPLAHQRRRPAALYAP